MYLPSVSPFLSSPPSVPLYLAASPFSLSLYYSLVSSFYVLSTLLFPSKCLQTCIQPGIVTLSLFLSPSVSLSWISRSSYLPVSSTYLLQATLNAGLARDNPRPSPPPATLPSSHSLSRPPQHPLRFARPLPHHTPPLRVSPFSLLVDGPTRIHKQLTNTQVA